MHSLIAWLTSKNTQSQLTLFLQIKSQPNIHQWRWYDMSEDCNFHRNQIFGRRIDHLFVYFWTSEIGHFDSWIEVDIERLLFRNKSLLISTSIQWDGISVLKHAQNLHSYCENSFWKPLCGGTCERWCTPSKVSWMSVVGRVSNDAKLPEYTFIHYSVLQQKGRHAIFIIFSNRLYILLFGFIIHVWYWHVFAEFYWHKLCWLKTLGLMPSTGG